MRVIPRAAADDLAIQGAALRARVRAPAVEGAANAAVIALLAARLRVARSAIRIGRGVASRTKVVSIAGLAAEEFWRRLGL